MKKIPHNTIGVILKFVDIRIGRKKQKKITTLEKRQILMQVITAFKLSNLVEILGHC